MIQKVEFVSVPPMKVLGFKEKSSIENMVENMEKILTCVGDTKEIEAFGSPIFIYHVQDAPTSEDPEACDVLIEICVPVEGENISCADEFKVYTLDGGQMISAIYKGPYEDIWEEKDKLYDFIEEKGFEVIGPERDVFIGNLEEDDENDKEDHTEILIPVKKIEEKS